MASGKLPIADGVPSGAEQVAEVTVRLTQAHGLVLPERYLAELVATGLRIEAHRRRAISA